MPYAAQLDELDTRARAILADTVPALAWTSPTAGPEAGFRNKAKLVVGGRRGAPTLGILDNTGAGIDLRHCGLYEPGLREAIGCLADLVADLGLTPYSVPDRTGELKNLLVTHAPDGRLMIRFVLRSPGQLPKIRRALPQLVELLPRTEVVSVNLLPRHVALVEGQEEILLTDARTLPISLPVSRPSSRPSSTGELTLHLAPRAFFQTNTAVATLLYRQARTWIEPYAVSEAWDLYCGVGGFALTLADLVDRLIGVEVSEEAIDGARLGALGLRGENSCATNEFVTGDAAAYAIDRDTAPDLILVNPPRRGIGEQLAAWLHAHPPRLLLYSSCNAETLARDLARIPNMKVQHARVFAMFPQTRHHEVLVLAARE